MRNLDHNTTESFLLNQISVQRFAHVFFSYSLPIRIIYKSSSLPSINQLRAFRLNLYKISEDYYHYNAFHYISYENNQTVMHSIDHSQRNFISSRIPNGRSMVNMKIRLFLLDYIPRIRISLFKQLQISI